jgi:hypothetical protein
VSAARWTRVAVVLFLCVVVAGVVVAQHASGHHHHAVVRSPSSGPARITRAACEVGWTFAVKHPDVKPMLDNDRLTLKDITKQGHASYIAACLASGSMIPVPATLPAPV